MAGSLKCVLAMLIVVGAVVATEAVSRYTIGSRARSHIGSTKWSRASSHVTGYGTNKCNIFVSDVLRQAGGSVPQRHWWCLTGGCPIGAREWSNPSSSYLRNDYCWTNVWSPAIGDVIAEGGHVGIVTGSSLTTSASYPAQRVVENDWGFRDESLPTLWRYTC